MKKKVRKGLSLPAALVCRQQLKLVARCAIFCHSTSQRERAWKYDSLLLVSPSPCCKPGTPFRQDTVLSDSLPCSQFKKKLVNFQIFFFGEKNGKLLIFPLFGIFENKFRISLQKKIKPISGALDHWTATVLFRSRTVLSLYETKRGRKIIFQCPRDVFK